MSPMHPRRVARIAGALYLLNGLAAGFAYGWTAHVYVEGDAAATTSSVLRSPQLVRLAVTADLFQATDFILLGMAFHALLQHAGKRVADAMVTFVAISTAIMCLNAAFELEALRVATGAVDLTSLGAGGRDSIVLLLFDAQHYGFLIAQIFFGLWLIPLGWLARRSGWFPRPLAILLMVGAAGYLLDVLVVLLLPGSYRSLHAGFVVPSAAAEISMVVYLLAVGVRPARDLRTGMH